MIIIDVKMKCTSTSVYGAIIDGGFMRMHREIYHNIINTLVFVRFNVIVIIKARVQIIINNSLFVCTSFRTTNRPCKKIQ